ncbi:hypothetical protein BH11VER1_BH11VER1_30100 [soil metagenome]
MAQKNYQLLSLPGEDHREVWRCRPDGEWELLPAGTQFKEGVLVLEALAFDSAPFWVRTSQGGELKLDEIASLHWEAQGLGVSDEGRAWTSWKVEEGNGRILVGTAGLAGEITAESSLEQMPQSCEISPQMYPIPSHEAAVWKEMGRYVIAFHRGTMLLHFSTLATRQLNAEAAQEILEIQSALEIREMLPQPKGVRVWCDAEVEFIPTLKSLLDGVPIIVEPRPSPRLPVLPSEIDPPELAQRRRLARKSRQTTRLLVLGAFLYAAVFAVWAGWLAYRDQKLVSEEMTLQQMEPELAVIREAQLRWQALEAATNPDQYPVEIFHRIASLLPAEGIRLEEFIFDTIDAKKMMVRGQASSSGEAVKFLANIKSSDLLKQYPWDAPVPNILPDNRASFRAEGALEALNPVVSHEPE